MRESIKKVLAEAVEDKVLNGFMTKLLNTDFQFVRKAEKPFAVILLEVARIAHPPNQWEVALYFKGLKKTKWKSGRYGPTTKTDYLISQHDETIKALGYYYGLEITRTFIEPEKQYLEDAVLVRDFDRSNRDWRAIPDLHSVSPKS
jgi:hypothetical protein